MLAQDENLDNIIQGFYNNSIGILVSTNRRLIFIDKGLIYGLKVEDFPLDKISSIQYETGLIMGKLKIHTSANIAVIDKVDKNQVRNFAEFVRNKIESKSESQNTSSSTVVESDIFDKLEKLGKLKDSGVLSEEEFNDQKTKLLGKI
ncbi:MAG: PH domain-containing protein [Flavobacteriales bacterium]